MPVAPWLLPAAQSRIRWVLIQRALSDAGGPWQYPPAMGQPPSSCFVTPGNAGMGTGGKWREIARVDSSVRPFSAPCGLQFSYEYCMRNYNVTDCLVEDSVINALYSNFTEYAAGFANPGDFTFLDHEWFKHGTCKAALHWHTPAFERPAQVEGIQHRVGSPPLLAWNAALPAHWSSLGVPCLRLCLLPLSSQACPARLAVTSWHTSHMPSSGPNACAIQHTLSLPVLSTCKPTVERPSLLPTSRLSWTGRECPAAMLRAS